MLFSKDAKAIISVCETDHPPVWINTLPEDGCMSNFARPEATNKNRQDFPQFYKVNGAIYLSYCDYIKEEKSFFGHRTFAYVMPKDRSVDIDDEVDFKLAELFKTNAGNKKLNL